MPIIKNGKTISTVKYGNADVASAKYHGVEVFRENKSIVILDVNDGDASQSSYFWYRANTDAALGDAIMEPQSNLLPLVSFDCTHYNTCIIKVNGYISSTPSGQIASHSYIKVGVGDDYDTFTTVIHKWVTEVGYPPEGQEGIAYNQTAMVKIDISSLTGVQNLNAWIGGAHLNAGMLRICYIELIG